MWTEMQQWHLVDTLGTTEERIHWIQNIKRETLCFLTGIGNIVSEYWDASEINPLEWVWMQDYETDFQSIVTVNTENTAPSLSIFTSIMCICLWTSLRPLRSSLGGGSCMLAGSFIDGGVNLMILTMDTWANSAHSASGLCEPNWAGDGERSAARAGHMGVDGCQQNSVEILKKREKNKETIVTHTHN